ncbi:M20/M25/M40 family metallo-hydrolase [Namhaeicola litoreus]|uniref:M20/M25/M40 family metallo-hydrolase n=1 Tax=Namhaeicola litoreus TaxID=1052145 RepID=A0ABW3Y595_9FLAO
MKFRFLFLLFVYQFTLGYAQKSPYSYLKINNEVSTLEVLLQKYIQIPSVSENEKEAGEFLKKVCKENGLIITDFGTENGNYNFAASLHPLDLKKPNIVFLNHIDVVMESESSKFGPYSGKIENGKVYGRGAIDNKGAAVMQLGAVLQALQLINKANSNYNVTFLSVSCEENQCKGGADFVAEHYLDILKPVVVIGEGPSEISTIIGGDFKHDIFGISVAHKRTLWLNLKLNIETAGHASITPHHYANKDMVKSLENLVSKKPKIIFNDVNVNFIKSLGEHKKGIEKLFLSHPKLFKVFLASQIRAHPELLAIYSNTLTLTNVYSDNNTYNKIPNTIEAYLDCRLLPETDETEFLKDIKKRLKNDSISVNIVEQTPRTYPSGKQNIYYQNLKKAIQMNYAGAEVISVIMPNLNDLGVFRSKGIPCYATIPVYFTREEVENIHNVDENIAIKSLYQGTQVYYDFIELMLE